jgi:hypothetical protein
MAREKEMDEPTPAELDTLAFHITRWHSRSPEEQVVCLAVLRGYCYVQGISAYVGIPALKIELLLGELLGHGLLRDNGRLLLH